MDGRGGCCIARHATGAYDMSQVNRIMLKFRPIAPKPVAGGTFSDGSSSESGDAFSRSGGAKRKYAKNNSSNSNQRCNRRTRRRRTTTSPVVTLPLLPETPDPKDPPVENNRNVPVWLSFDMRGHAAAEKEVVDPCWYGGAVDPAAVRFGGSLVMVECVTDTWQHEEDEVLGLKSTEEWRVKLSEDTCPGFVSDGYGRVTWTNGAYREMVGEGGVWLVMKFGVPYRGFTCRVRVQYACGKERTVPCDVWRMDNGGFAWRLDVKAALSLSLAL